MQYFFLALLSLTNFIHYFYFKCHLHADKFQNLYFKSQAFFPKFLVHIMNCALGTSTWSPTETGNEFMLIIKNLFCHFVSSWPYHPSSLLCQKPRRHLRISFSLILWLLIIIKLMIWRFINIITITHWADMVISAL